MPESVACLNARVSLEEIRTLKGSFDSLYATAVTSGKLDEVARARDTKTQLLERMVALQETLFIVEVERVFDLRRQYETQTALLHKTGLMETRTERDASGIEQKISFMTGIDGKVYTMPSYETIVSRLTEQKELFETKADQGFTKLLLVPFGMKLDDLLAKFRAFLKNYKKKRPEFARANPAIPDDSDKPSWDPLSVWTDGYVKADVDGKLVYRPTLFDVTNHGGKTKTQMLAEDSAKGSAGSGWSVLLLQTLDNGGGFRGIPRAGQGTTKGTKVPRPDIEAGQSARDYLAAMHRKEGDADYNPAYAHESGMTPEEWIIMDMAQITETGLLMDNYQNGKESTVYLKGAYFVAGVASGGVPNAYWDRDVRQAYVNGSDPDYGGEGIGVRSAVRV